MSKLSTIFKNHFSLCLYFVFTVSSCNNKESSKTSAYTDAEWGKLLDTAYIISEEQTPQKAFYYLSQKLADKKIGWLDSDKMLLFKSNVYSHLTFKHDSALYFIKQRIELLHQLNPNDNLVAARIYYALGDSYYNSSDLDSAIHYFEIALTLSKYSENIEQLSLYYYMLGMVNYRKENYREAKISFQQSYEHHRKTDNNYAGYYQSQEILSNIGLCFFNLKQYDSSIYYYHATLKLIQHQEVVYEDHENAWETARAVAYENMGSAFVEKNNSDSAQYYFALAEEFYHLSKANQHYLLLTYIKMFDAELRLHNEIDRRYLIPFQYLTQHDATIKQDPQLVTRYLSVLYRYYEKTGQIDSAYKHLKEYHAVLHTTTNELNKAKLELLHDRLDSNYAQRQIDLREEKLRNNNLAIIILLLLLGTGGVFFYFRRKLAITLYEQLRKEEKIKKQLLHEIEENKVLIKLIEQKQKDRQLFTRAVVHDLMNPLAGLNLKIEMYALLPHLTVQGKAMLANAKGIVEDMIETCTDLMEYSDEHKSKSLQLSDIVLTDLIEKCKNNVAAQLLRKNQELKVALPQHPITIKADNHKLTRLFTNLLSNSSKFSNSNATIELSVKTEQYNILFMVKDNGIGMTNNNLKKLFEQPYDDGNTGTLGEKSYGLGLWICKQIVDAHKGTISVESEINKGSTFIVTIPMNNK